MVHACSHFPLFSGRTMKKVRLPSLICFVGATAGSAAGPSAHAELEDWNNTATFQQLVEGALGSWDNQLPTLALERYYLGRKKHIFKYKYSESVSNK